MLRRILVSAVVAGLVTGTGLAAAGPLHPPTVAAQEDAERPEAVELAPGERFSLSDVWELEVQRAFLAASPDRARYHEVRVAVAFRNTSSTTVVFSRAALADAPEAYPWLRLRDAAGVVHPLPLTRPDRFSVSGANLGSLPPGATARWTVGFQVPSIYAHDLAVEAVWQDRVLAVWDLQAPPTPLSGWAAPPEVRTLSLGQELAWGPDLVITPTGFGTRLCGNPAREHAVLVFQLTVLVENISTTDALWPGTKYPQVPGVAIWGDGASARFSAETFPGAEEPLDRHSFETTVIPPHAPPPGGIGAPPEARALVFVVPRDGRFGPAALSPQAVMLFPPVQPADPVWLGLSGSPAITPAAAWCDVYEPSIPYRVTP